MAGSPVCVSVGTARPQPVRVSRRAQAVRTAFQHAPHPRSLSAAATLYHQDHAVHLRHRGLITRLPHAMRPVAEAITHALALARWARREETTRDQRLEL